MGGFEEIATCGVAVGGEGVQGVEGDDEEALACGRGASAQGSGKGADWICWIRIAEMPWTLKTLS